MKCVAAERNMLESENKLGEYDVHKLEQQLVDLKKRYFREKKLRQTLQEASRFQDLNPAVLPVLRAGIPEKFTGGGFRVSHNLA
ncbi:hypothetical protein ACOMHN_042590 [Nucella lapillus]